MVRMEIKFLTPTEVWEGFDAHKAPLEASIISAQTQDNIVCSQQIFTADTTKEGRVRVFCKIFTTDVGKTNAPLFWFCLLLTTHIRKKRYAISWKKATSLACSIIAGH